MSTSTLPGGKDNGGDKIQLVVFNLGTEEYGIDVLKVREIIRMSNVTRVPNTPQYIKGVLNLRGKVIPIISLRERLNLGESEPDRKTRIIITETATDHIGFIVDGVAEVLRISPQEIQPPPASLSGAVDQNSIHGVINMSDRLLVLLDMDKMFRQAGIGGEFLTEEAVMETAQAAGF